MPQTFNQTVNTKFNKGLLTEFSELTFPEDASVDELNCSLHKAGNRSKRKGLEYEDNYNLTNRTYSSGTLMHTDTWSDVGGNSNLEFLVVQTGSRLRFYRKGANPLSDGVVNQSYVSSTPYILNMNPFEYASGLGAGASKVDVASVDGYLVVVSPQIEAFYIIYNDTDGTFSTKTISFKIRDYGYYGDPAERDQAVATPPVDVHRLYDTENTGWESQSGDTALATYLASENAYPPLTHPWYSGKNSSGVFDVTEWDRVFGGSSLISNGHYALDLFNPVRATTVGDTFTTDWEGKTIKVPSGRFSAVTSYAGRVWYTGVDSRVYYSKIVETADYFGDCYSHNDPTAEYSSDVLATDGGYINLPEANGIKKLHVFGSSLLIFADNGVWRISGVDGNLFQADDFSVYKITDFGLAFRGSFVGGQNALPFWWSYSGIHTIVVTENGGMIEQNLSRDTIQTFWKNIGANERAFVTTIYDASENKILWLYPNTNETVEYKLNNILFLDADLGSFYPWKISDAESDSPYVVGASFFNGKGSDEVTFNVVDENDDQVLDAAGNEVVTVRDAGTVASSNVYFLTRDPTGSLTFSLFKSVTFLDWGSANYEAFAESGYNFIGDLGRKKNSPFITVFLRQTETGFTLDGTSYLPISPSSLKVSAYWDFKKTPSTPPQEAYRHKQPIIPEDLADFPTPTTVLATRLKLRGRGRSMRLRFEGTEGNDFNLLGWETLDTRNGGY